MDGRGPEFAAFEDARPARERPTILVRSATPGDAATIAAINAAREGLNVADVEPRVRRDLETTTQQSRRACCVAVVAGAVVGYGRTRWMDPAAEGPARVAPAGWYLSGVVVAPSHRRLGVGDALTRHRLDALAAAGAEEAWYFANARNLATIRLHERFGFEEVASDFAIPGVSFTGGRGLLFRKRPLSA